MSGVVPEARQVSAVPEARQVSTVPEARQVSAVPEARPVSAVPEARPVSTVPEARPVSAVPEARQVNSAGQPGPVPECLDEVCITCSDTAVPVTVVRLLDDGFAVVDTGRGEEEVSVALVSARAGDTVLVHAGEAIAVVAP